MADKMYFLRTFDVNAFLSSLEIAQGVVDLKRKGY